ncbi:hypothetical protein AHAS_Ahas15G0235600 [Arachis hypogaea]
MTIIFFSDCSNDCSDDDLLNGVLRQSPPTTIFSGDISSNDNFSNGDLLHLPPVTISFNDDLLRDISSSDDHLRQHLEAISFGDISSSRDLFRRFLF